MFKSFAVAASLTLAMSAASAAASYNVGSATVAYDETTTFGNISSSFSSSNDTFGFSWTVPNTANIFSAGTTEIAVFDLPSFKLTPNAGYTLGGPVRVTLGNFAFFEVGGATTNISIAGDVSLNGAPPTTLSGLLDFQITSSGSTPVSHVGGYLFLDQTYNPGAFNSLEVTNASITLSAANGTFSQIIANPQNKLEISFTAPPVPEPETAAMLLVGLVAVGWITQRRRSA